MVVVEQAVKEGKAAPAQDIWTDGRDEGVWSSVLVRLPWPLASLQEFILPFCFKLNTQ